MGQHLGSHPCAQVDSVEPSGPAKGGSGEPVVARAPRCGRRRSGRWPRCRGKLLAVRRHAAVLDSSSGGAVGGHILITGETGTGQGGRPRLHRLRRGRQADDHVNTGGSRNRLESESSATCAAPSPTPDRSRRSLRCRPASLLTDRHIRSPTDQAPAGVGDGESAVVVRTASVDCGYSRRSRDLRTEGAPVSARLSRMNTGRITPPPAAGRGPSASRRALLASIGRRYRRAWPLRAAALTPSSPTLAGNVASSTMRRARVLMRGERVSAPLGSSR